MSIYHQLGVTPLINAAGTYTAVGGSRMSEKTLSHMCEAAHTFVNIRELQKAVNKRLAELTNNEAAAVCNGAASGLYICCATCITLLYNKSYNFLSKAQIEESEFIVFRAHRNPYDWGLRLMGVTVKELGFPNIIQPATIEELEASISSKTAGIFYAYSAPNGWISDGELGLEDTITIAKKYNIPVIVDAAAQLPKKENLWHITKNLGATVALFSGGKELRGPQSSGLIVGESKFLKVFVQHNFPNYGPGRMLKTGREELIGLLSAVEQYIEEDTEKRIQWCEDQVQKLIQFGSTSSLYTISYSFPNEAGQPIPRAEIKLTDSAQLEKLVLLLAENTPSIYTTLERGRFFINPTCLYDGETEIIIHTLEKIQDKLK
ncbi:MAG: hypothetical protein ACRC0X_00320 [Brevinema sp.]